jgi:hypothetical protein
MIKYKEFLVYPNNAIFRNRARRIKPRVACLCVCPSCHKKYVVKSNSLYTDRINWIYCERDERNRFRNPEGYDYDNLFQDSTKKADPSFIDDMKNWHKSKKRLGV